MKRSTLAISLGTIIGAVLGAIIGGFTMKALTDNGMNTFAVMFLIVEGILIVVGLFKIFGKKSDKSNVAMEPSDYKPFMVYGRAFDEARVTGKARVSDEAWVSYNK